MNAQRTDGENKWHVAKVVSQEQKQADTVKNANQAKNSNGCHGWRQMKTEMQSIAIYYISTIVIFPLFYGAYDSNYSYIMGSYNYSAYFLICSLIPLFCLAYISCKMLLDEQNANRITKSISVIYFALVVNNVVMAIDAYINLEQWEALDTLDTFIHGNNEWWIPIGASDIALILLGLACTLNLSLYARRLLFWR